MKLLKLVPADTNIKFLKLRVPFFAFSLLLIAASWALVLTQGLNYGVDFAGGQEIQATFTQSEQAPVPDIRDTVSSIEGVGDPVQAAARGGGQPRIRQRHDQPYRRRTRSGV